MTESSGKTILCVDDEPTILKTLELILQMNGYRVLTATSIEQALSVAGQEQQVDVVLLDFSVCHAHCVFDEIKKRQPSVKLAIHTGNPDVGECKGNAAHILPKPIDPRKLLAELNKLCA